MVANAPKVKKVVEISDELISGIPCKTIYAQDKDPFEVYACYSRFHKDLQEKLTILFRLSKRAKITTAEADEYVTRIIIPNIPEAYQKALVCKPLTKKVWQLITEKLQKRTSLWDNNYIDLEDVPWMVAECQTQAKDTTQQGWFALLTLLREPQEYPQFVHGMVRALHKGVSPDEAFCIGNFFHTGHGHSTLVSISYPKEFVEESKNYSILQCFMKAHNGQGLNYAFEMKNKPYTPFERSSRQGILDSNKEALKWAMKGWSLPQIRYYVRLFCNRDFKEDIVDASA